MDHEFWNKFAKHDGTEPQLKFHWWRRSLHLLDVNWSLCLYCICCSVVICFSPLTPNDPYTGHTSPLTSKVAF
jgi:hypothetical protein